MVAHGGDGAPVVSISTAARVLKHRAQPLNYHASLAWSHACDGDGLTNNPQQPQPLGK